MIYYVREGNTVYAYYGNLDGDITNNQYASKYWYNDLLRYFLKHTPEISREDIGEVILSVISECTESGMKFYGEAKCHPDDKFSYNLGWYIAKNRLLDKYLRIRARIAKRIRKAVYKDCYQLDKIAKSDRKMGW